MTPEQIFALSISYRLHEKEIRAQYMAKRMRETPLFRDVRAVWHVGGSGSGKSYTVVKLMEAEPESVYLMNDYCSFPFCLVMIRIKQGYRGWIGSGRMIGCLVEVK